MRGSAQSVSESAPCYVSSAENALSANVVHTSMRSQCWPVGKSGHSAVELNHEPTHKEIHSGAFTQKSKTTRRRFFLYYYLLFLPRADRPGLSHAGYLPCVLNLSMQVAEETIDVWTNANKSNERQGGRQGQRIFVSVSLVCTPPHGCRFVLKCAGDRYISVSHRPGSHFWCPH